MDSESNGQRKIQSVARAADILKCFEESRELRLMDIVRRTELNKSTVFGIISTLISAGFIQQDTATGKYSIGIEAFRVGQMFKPDMVKTVRPYLTALSDEFHETANFVVRDGLDIIYLEKVESTLSMRISTYRGLRKPMYSNGAGKAIWAFLDEEERESLLNKCKFEKITDKTIGNRDEMAKELEIIKERGYSIDDEETEIGLYCVAAPIIGKNSIPVGAISVSGPKIRISQGIEAKIAERLSHVCRDIANGYC